MQVLLKTLGNGIISLAVFMLSFSAFADPRGAANTNRGTAQQGRSASSARMPVMAILPYTGLGNVSVGVGSGNTNVPTNTPVATPTDDNGGGNNGGDNGGGNNGGDNGGGNNGGNNEPTTQLCDLSYTVNSCMQDIAACVNGGALPNGINSMFNEELRESIFNGMGLCLNQVEYCIANVHLPRSDNNGCVPMYQSTRDVWLDFNARRVQPEYYNFVLRRTGLTPIQAENTCLLLDRNTYGNSFNAVAGNNTTSEYGRDVSAYNQKPKKDYEKTNPMGADVNSNGEYDSDRGYYARWDAENAQCLLRVAAYHDKKLIKNNMLGIGDDRPAQAWRATGESFTCDKDLFGFALNNKTRAAATIALPGGAAAGAGLSFLFTHGDKEFDCKDKSQRKALTDALRQHKNVNVLRQFLKDHAISDASSADLESQLTNIGSEIKEDVCKQLLALYEIYNDGVEALKNCADTATSYNVKLDLNTQRYLAGQCGLTRTITTTETTETTTNTTDCSGGSCSYTTIDEKITEQTCPVAIDKNIRENPDIAKEVSAACSFKELNQALQSEDSVYCHTREGCIIRDQFDKEIAKLRTGFSGLENVFAGQKSNRAKGAAIGAGAGLAAGGAATLITSLVERDKIHCRVGDDLARVDYKKAYTIDRLRDFYVKWALQVPKTPSNMTALIVTSCDNWDALCKIYTGNDECENAKVGYMPENIYSPREVEAACEMRNGACRIKMSTAGRYGIVAESCTEGTSGTVPGTATGINQNAQFNQNTQKY